MKETEQKRLSKSPTPMPILRKGTPVSIYMGAGWEKGTVTDSTKRHCSVRLNRGTSRTKTCFDARNIKLS
jgi:hypothetical protein